ncbi:hypothetical protein ABK040_007814 [Willaertia magna]
MPELFHPTSPVYNPLSPTTPKTLEKTHSLSGYWNNNIFYPANFRVFDSTMMIDKIRIINNVDVDEWKDAVSVLMKNSTQTWDIVERVNNKLVITKKIQDLTYEIVIHQTSFTMGELRYEKENNPGLKIFIDYIMFYKFQ